MRSSFDCKVGCVDRLDGHSLCFSVQIRGIELGCIDCVLSIEANPLPDFPVAVVAVQVEVPLWMVFCLALHDHPVRPDLSVLREGGLAVSPSTVLEAHVLPDGHASVHGRLLSALGTYPKILGKY